MFDYFNAERLKTEEAGDCDFDGLFIRLIHAIEVVTADRTVLDNIESLF